MCAILNVATKLIKNVSVLVVFVHKYRFFHEPGILAFISSNI